MMRLIKLLFTLCLLVGIVLTGWSYGKSHFGKEFQQSGFAAIMDKAVKIGLHTSAPVLNPFRKPLQSVLGHFFKEDYTASIRAPITAGQLESILQLSRQSSGERMILLYLYSLDCNSCNLNYADVNALAAAYPKDKVLVLAIAVGVTPLQLSDYMNTHGGIPAFKPLIMNAGEEPRLATIAWLRDIEFSKIPYLGVIDKSGRINTLPYGLERGAAIRAKFDEIFR